MLATEVQIFVDSTLLTSLKELTKKSRVGSNSETLGQRLDIDIGAPHTFPLHCASYPCINLKIG